MMTLMTHIDALSQAWPMGIATYRLRGIEDAMELATTCRQYWFRGHPQEYPSLLPAVYREPLHSAHENIEFRAAQRFRLRARSFVSSVPDWGDHLSWLLMMQHHGVPTRLLDWTTSILVALYFAAVDKVGKDDKPADGEVWCMNPARLNWCSSHYICGPDDPPIRYLAAAVFLDAKQLPRLAEDLGLDNPPARALAIIPPFEFPRIAAQMSRFTMHPSRDGTAMIEYLLRSETCLVRYTVPAANKARLRKDLASLGVSHDTLYHSLESLARTIREEIVEKDYKLMHPPHFRSESDSS
jgi:FRG domain